MNRSRTIRVLFLGSMLGSIVVVLAWSGFLAWRKWPEWRAVREMRAAVEANEPGRFLDAVEAVDSLGVAEWVADEIAPLRHHAEPRVRMYAVMALTVLGPRGADQAKELIELFDDPEENDQVRCMAGHCFVLLGERAREAVPSLLKAMVDIYDPRRTTAFIVFCQLGESLSRPETTWLRGHGEPFPNPPGRNATLRETADFLMFDAGTDQFMTVHVDYWVPPIRRTP